MSSRVFKLFLSSTFGDFQAEREVLRERVWPKLEHFCKSKGAAFQVVDLRWGVSEADGLSHDSLRICLDEVARCRKISPKPNFVMLIGDRYGWRPLPAEILADEFEEIIAQLDGVPEKTNLLQRWYRRDDNAIPPHYRLLPRDGEYATPSAWANVEAQLTAILRDSARALGITPERRERYFLSATHLEIIRGALAVSDSDEHVLAIFRNIDGITSLPATTDQVARFTDVVNGTFDEEATSLRTELSAEVTQVVPDQHRFNYQCQWVGESNRPISTSHIDELCGDVERSLLEMISSEFELQEGDEIDQEAARHTQFAKERAETFIGRENEIEQLQLWLKQALLPSKRANGGIDQATLSNQPPLLVHGPGGVGKSAFMARALVDIEQRHPDAVVIRRFIGASPRSVDLHSFVGDLLKEISRRYGQAEHLPEGGLKELLEELPIRLSWATDNRPLILAIDALDQFSESLEARHHLWLPQALPQNVSLVISTIDGPINDAVHLKYPEAVSIPILSFSRSEGGNLLDALLSAGDDVAPERKRCLSSEQRSLVLNAFAADGRPLYIKIASNFVRRWPSWIAPEKLPDSLEGLIRLMVKHLREVHGASIADRALDYLSASRFGVSDDEIRDLLWRDEEAHAEFERRKNIDQPTVNTLPPVIWSRIYADLAPYLAAQSIDGMLLFRFYHRVVGEEIAKVCLVDDKTLVHSRLAKYFADQPLYFVNGTEKVPNLRKLMEEPWQWIMAGELDKAEALITNFDFAMAKCRANRFDDFLDDMRLLVDKKRESHQTLSSELAIWDEFYRSKAHILRRGSDAWSSHKILLQLAAEYADGTPITQSVDEWLSQGKCDWVWLRDLHRPDRYQSDACLAVLEGHKDEINGVQVLTDGCILSWSKDGTLRLWDGENGDSLVVFEGHTSGINGVKVLDDHRIISWSEDGTLHLWHRKSGDTSVVLEGHTSGINGVIVLDDHRILSWSNDNTMRIWNLQNGTSVQLKGHESLIRGVAVLTNGCILSWSNDKTLRIWDVLKNTSIVLKGHTDNIKGVHVIGDYQLVSWSRDKTLRIWDLLNNTSEALVGHTESIDGVILLADNRLVSWSREKSLRIWDVKNNTSTILEGHTAKLQGVQILTDGRILSWSSDMTLRIWEVGSFAPVCELKGHKGGIVGVQVLSNGRILSWSSDTTLRIWEVGSFAPVCELKGHKVGIIGVQVLTDGRIFSWSKDNAVHLWDIPRNSFLKFEGHLASIKGVEALTDKTILTWARDKTIRIWNIQNRSIADEDHTNRIIGLTVLSDGRTLSWSNDKTLRIWDEQNGTSILLEGHTDCIYGVQVLADGRILSTSRDNTLRIWDGSNGSSLVLEGHLENIRGARFLADNSILSWSNDKTLRIWDVQKGTSILLEGHTDYIYGAQVLSDGRILSWSNDKSLRVWNVQDRTSVVLEGHAGSIYDAQILTDGRILSRSTDKTLRVWNIQSGVSIVLEGHYSNKGGVDALPDGRFILKSIDDNIFRIWDVKSSKLLALEGHSNRISGYKILANGRLLTWSKDFTLRLWDEQSGEPLNVLEGHTGEIKGVRVLDDNHILSWSADNTLRLWDLQDGTSRMLKSHKSSIIGIEVLTDGRILSWSNDRALCIWDVRGGSPLVELIGHKTGYNARIVYVKEISRGRIITCSDDGELKVWDTHRVKCLDNWQKGLLHVRVDNQLGEGIEIIPSAILLSQKSAWKDDDRMCWADHDAKIVSVVSTSARGTICVQTANKKFHILQAYRGSQPFLWNGASTGNSSSAQDLN